MADLREIFDKLGLDKDNGLFITNENTWQKETVLPNRVKRLLENKILPDAFFCFDNKPLILFFNRTEDKPKKHKQIWNFNESPISIFVDNDVVEIFNGFKYLKDRKRLDKLGGHEKLDDFSYFRLVTGKTWEQYQIELDYKNRIDYHLLDNIRTARKVLVEDKKLNAKVANSIIGKSIFVRYLIDRRVKLKFASNTHMWSNDEFCELLDKPQKVKEFFDYLEDKERGFNGDLFPLTKDEYATITKEHYQVIERLLKGEELEEKQFSLFEFYDFSIIPIEFISNVYELFIGEENQKKAGAYYTPLFLIDYMLKETVENHLNKPESGYDCKVLDPACGSGIFLVETLRKIIEKYKTDTNINPQTQSKEFKQALKQLAKDNIYGVDKDISAVQVAIFSVYLTLLDYLEPPSIETFTFPELFNINFFEADFFDEDSKFNKRFKEIKFDFILGNPPWKGSGMEATGKKYLENRKQIDRKLRRKYDSAINNNEIVEGFVLRVSDFCTRSTRVALIIRSSCLYNMGYKEGNSPFRQYWLEEFFVDKVFELSPVRYEIFEKSNNPAVAPAAVIFYRYAFGEDTEKNLLEHMSLKQSRFFTLFKIFSINRIDYKKIAQKHLKQYDWLWKVLVYGSYLDFNFIKRLKNDYGTIKEIISDDNSFIEGTGIQFSSNPTYDSKHLVGQPFVDAYGITPFFILPDKISHFNKEKVHRLRDERLFKAPMLLVRKGLDMKTLTARSAISKRDLLFKDGVTSIKSFKKDNITILQNIASLFSSKLFSYYAINMFASVGIEREQSHNYNKFTLPYLDLNLSDVVDKIEQASRKINTEKKRISVDNIKISRLQDEIEADKDKINKTIFDKLDLDNIESSLIHYALDVNLKLIVGNDKIKQQLFTPIQLYDDILRDYAMIFIERFKHKLDTDKKKFSVQIWYTKQIIGMFFKMIPIDKYSNSITWEDKQNKDIEVLSLLTSISSEKVTDSLFVRKDLRGFEKQYFYIFKPNEKRLWHQAIGYWDVNEFAEAMLKQGRKRK